MTRDFGEFKSKGIVWCRFDDPFATSHLLASKFRIGNAMVSVQLWGASEAEVQAKSGNRLLQSLAMGRPTGLSTQTIQVKNRESTEEEIDEENEVEEDRLQTSAAIIQTTFKVIVGNRAVEIDIREKCRLGLLVSNVVELCGFLDHKELETNAYFELTSEIERQMMKFGQINSLKILRKSEGYQNPGKVLVEYQKIEAAILAKFTIGVFWPNIGYEVLREACQDLVW